MIGIIFLAALTCAFGLGWSSASIYHLSKFKKNWDGMKLRFDEISAYHAEIVRKLTIEIEELIKADYWSDRHNIVKRQLDSALGAIGHLRASAKAVMAQHNPSRHGAPCHCFLCVTGHALSATSGYEPRKQGVENGKEEKPGRQDH